MDSTRSHARAMNERRPGSRRLLAAVVCVGWLAATPAIGQESRGAITGTAHDTSGSVVPGATVTVTNVAMATNVTVITNDVGYFQALYLIPGQYRVTIELTGFKKVVRDGIDVRVGDRLELELVLELGGTQEEVTVSAAAPLLETTNASLGQVVDARRVAELPTPHGDPFSLIGLAAGTSFVMSARLDRPFEPTHIVGYSVNGTRSNRSDITIDGIPSTSTANAGEVIASYVPPQDLVQEFKVQTATFDASFGNTEGGVTNVSIKSGTNQFHGTGYFVKMPANMFANDFFANASNIPLPDFSYNRWGGTVGGPIIKQRTFFMFGHEGIDEARPRNNGTPTVPTERMRNGDFSELLALGPQYQIYNPFTRRSIGNGRFQQDPFPGNIIPQELINPVSRAILAYIGTPKTPGNPDGSGNFQQPELKESTAYTSNTIRVDHNMSNRQRLYGRVSWYDRNSNYNNYFNNLSTGEWFKFISRQVAVDYVNTLNATTVLNVRYGYDRFVRGTNANPDQRGFDLTSLGFPASYASQIPEDIRRFPRINITGYQGTAIGGEERPTETQAVIATVNKTKGAHGFRAGTEVRRYRETDVFFGNNQTGQFDFTDTWTRGPLDNSTPAPGSRGQSVAAFLLGLPTTGSVLRAAEYDEHSTTLGLFVQDDWRIGSKLTLNLGLRYEYETPLTEVDDRSVGGFDFAAVQPIEAASRAAYARNPTPEVPVDQFDVRGGLLFPGVGGQSRGLFNTPSNNFMPRVGLAYQIDDKTVLRGGYGLFYGFLGQRRGDVVQSGFSANTNQNLTLDNGLTFIETLSNPFQGGIQEPVGAAAGIETFLGQGVTFFAQDPVSPRTQRWQVGLQRELPGAWLAELTYVGAYGSDLLTTRNINSTPNEYLSTSPTRDTATINYLGAQVPNPFSGLLPTTALAALRGGTIPRERLLRPYPQFDNVTTTTNEGESWFQSFQVNLQRRFSKGYTLGMSYTWSRFEEATEFLNGDDPSPTRHISSQDVPHKLAVSGIVELPFGEGRRLGSDVNAVVSKFISGWQLSGIYIYQSGLPIGNFGNLLFTGNVDDIALSSSDRTLQRWFNTDAGFNKVSTQQLGSNVRTFPLRFDSVRSHEINNVDLSLIKNTTIAGDVSLQLRLEALNAFNHPLYPAPAGDSLNPTTAVFGSIVASTQANYSRRTQVMVKLIF